MQSTCGLYIAATTRPVGSLSKLACTEAITQSSGAISSSSTSTSPLVRMFTSMPFRMRNGASFSFSASISSH